MHAYILTGGSENERSDRINSLLSEQSVSPHDTITIAPDGPSIGVESVRGVESRLSIRPVAGKRHAVIIRDAQIMTIPAQNAFLKTLEEPPGDALIILETSQPDALLPTILSRCHTIRLAGDTAPSYQCDVLEQLRTSPIGERLKIIDSLTKTRDEAIAFVNLGICTLEQDLKKTGRNAKLLRALLAARTQILGNVTPKLALDAVFGYTTTV